MMSQGMGYRSRSEVDGILGFNGQINKVEALADSVYDSGLGLAFTLGVTALQG